MRRPQQPGAQGAFLYPSVQSQAVKVGQVRRPHGGVEQQQGEKPEAERVESALGKRFGGPGDGPAQGEYDRQKIPARGHRGGGAFRGEQLPVQFAARRVDGVDKPRQPAKHHGQQAVAEGFKNIRERFHHETAPFAPTNRETSVFASCG